MIVFPNAKINLGLDVLRRRDDGYHDISTVMIPIPWNDILEIVPSTGNRDNLTVTGNSVNCPPEQNLVMKAVTQLRMNSFFPEVDIFLHKVIPDGAGLGGGSSDAAFTLVALNDLFELGLSKDALAHMASTLGADCPFFIYNKPMLCEGTGTTLSEFEFYLPEGLSIVVVKPNVSIPTKEAYGGVSPSEPKEHVTSILKRPITEWQDTLKNDFEQSVVPLHPIIGDIKQHLVSIGALYSSMSGSGSAVYGLFRGDIMTDSLTRLFPGSDILVKKMS